MSKHTPGPWYQNKANPLVICAPDGFNDPWYVAEATTNCGHTEDQTEANARLIAAAPDLLKALEHCLGWIDNWSPDFIQDDAWPEYRRAFDAAIAKAKGEA